MLVVIMTTNIVPLGPHSTSFERQGGKFSCSFLKQKAKVGEFD